MRFHRPDTIAEAIAVLGESAGNICLAGGGVVVPALRHGPPPGGLVSLRRIGELRTVDREGDGSILIGATTPHVDVARSAMLTGGLALVRQAAAEIAHPVIRNMATIGGTVCRADPASDYGCALLAAGAHLRLRSRRGERTVAIDDFARGDNDTVRQPDELLTFVSLPGTSGSSAYVRFSRVDGDSPTASAGVRLEWRDGAVSAARIAIGGCGPTPFRVAEAEERMCGVRAIGGVSPAVFDAAVAAARPVDDIKGSADYRRRLIPGLLRRALMKAFAEAPA